MRYEYVILHKTMFNKKGSCAYYLCVDIEDAKRKIAELHVCSSVEIFSVLRYVPVEYEITDPIVTLKG